MPLDEFRDLFEQAAIPEGDFHTLAGFVVARLGHIPRVEESLDYSGLHFEVVEMDGNRVDRILVRPVRARAENLDRDLPCRDRRISRRHRHR